MQGRPSAVVLRVWISTGLEQSVSDGRISVVNGNPKRCRPDIARGIGIGASVEQCRYGDKGKCLTILIGTIGIVCRQERLKGSRARRIARIGIRATTQALVQGAERDGAEKSLGRSTPYSRRRAPIAEE